MAVSGGGGMTRYEYWINTPAGREWFKDMQAASDAAQNAANKLGVPIGRHDLNGGVSLFQPVGATLTSPKQTCIECGHVANVGREFKTWCCRKCERIQATKLSAWDALLPQFRSEHIGWSKAGEFYCPCCSTIIGKNLLGAAPILLASQHLTANQGVGQ